MRLFFWFVISQCLFSIHVFAKDERKKIDGNIILISHVNIVNVENNDVKPNQFVLIVDDKIRSISSIKPIAVDNAIDVDGKGKFLMAGLVDMHVHVFQPADLYQLITHGVTTARVMYGWPHVLKYREVIKQNKLIGPDLIVASPVINQKSPYASSNLHRFVNSPEEASNLVAEYAKKGFDLIKTYDGLQPEIFKAISKSAQENGLAIAGHPSFYFSIDDFLEEKPQTIEHIEMLYQAQLNYSRDNELLLKLAKKLAEAKIPVTTTLIVYDNLAKLAVEKNKFIDSLPTEYIHPLVKKLEEGSVEYITTLKKPNKWRSKADYLGYIVKVLNENNVPIVLGSDGGVGYTINGKSTIDEIELLSHYGVPNNDILRAATITPAIALNRDNEIGSVTTGFIANLILLNSDPRKDLSTLREPFAVIKSGNLIDQTTLNDLDVKAKKHMDWSDVAINLYQAL